MSKQGYYPGQTRGHGSGTLARTDQVTDDERPFAEFRKNLQDVLRMLTLHRWAFFVISCVVASGAFVLSLYYPRTYQAQTSFDRHNDPILADLKMSQGAATFGLFRTTVNQDLTSKECMAEVVERIGLIETFERNPDGTLTAASARRRDTLALALADKISIATRSPNEHTDVVNITYTGPDPAIGSKLLDAMKETYIRRTKAWVQDHLLGLREYYVAETAKALSVLREAERNETAMRLENPLINPQNKFCKYCSRRSLYFDRSLSALLYDDTLRYLIHLFKYGK
ncbi:MAG: hypothetical protein KJ749_11295, partial [Planctomycetes bacterium]|nr:hypothetical protein [Planctomycetota bacterium]